MAGGCAKPGVLRPAVGAGEMVTIMFDEGRAGKAPAPSLVMRRLADEACREVGFRRAEARLVKAISASKVLVAHAIRTTAAVQIRLAIHVRRQAIQGVPRELDGKGRAPKRYSKSLRERVVNYAGQWLGWPMSKGQTLGASTSDQIEAEAIMYEAKASGHAIVGRFMRLVQRRMKAAKAKPKTMVANVLNDAELGRLMSKASES